MRTLEQLAQAIIYSQKDQNMARWCYETLPHKVTHLSPIPPNGCNFLRKWSHGVKWHVWLWSNMAHISISPYTGGPKQCYIRSGARVDGLPNTGQGGWPSVDEVWFPHDPKRLVKALAGVMFQYKETQLTEDCSWRKLVVLCCHMLICNQQTAKYITQETWSFHLKPSPL